MDMPLATFSYDELEKILVRDNFIPGTEQFYTEFRRRYRAVDGNSNRYMERYAWLANRAA